MNKHRFFDAAKAQLPEAVGALRSKLQAERDSVTLDSLLDSLREELQAAREALAPQIEGFQDLSMVNLKTETRQQVEMDLKAGRRRETLLVGALNALLALTEDGYPDVPVIRVMELIYNDLVEQERTIHAAVARYEPLPREAVGGEVTIED